LGLFGGFGESPFRIWRLGGPTWDFGTLIGWRFGELPHPEDTYGGGRASRKAGGFPGFQLP